MLNRCKEIGCPAACCYSSPISFSDKDIADKFLQEAKKGGVEIQLSPEKRFNAPSALALIANPDAKLIIVLNDPRAKGVQIQIFGACPFLDDNNQCSIYYQPFRPPACQKLTIGNSVCNARRQEKGLPPISLQNIQSTS